MVNLFDELKQRGLITQTTNESEIKELINNGQAYFYVGIDPTANSLHIGHLIVLTFVKRLIKNGNKAIIVIGGGTSLIGDPSNKNDMRKMLSNKDINQNCKLLKKQLKKIFSGLKITILNNNKWLSKQKFLDFIRQIGIFFNINEMIKADCYHQRINNGLTFLEFSYMLLQAYDFYYLNKKYGCNLQIGGNDQWCNMLAGINIIKKNSDVNNINVLTIKLLTDSNGNKMGKTENGAIWLDQDKISEEIYKNFWINIPDNDLFNYMKMLSFEKLEEIVKKEKEFQSNHNIENINKVKEEFANEMLKYRIKIFKFNDLIKKIKKIFQSKKNTDILFCNFYKNDDNILVREILVQSKKYQNKKEVLNLIRNEKILVNNKVINNYNYQLNENDIVIVDNKYQFRIKKVKFKDLDVEAKKNFYQKLMVKIENKNFDWDQKFRESFSDTIYFFKKNSKEKKEKIFDIFVEKFSEKYFDYCFENRIFEFFSSFLIFFKPNTSFDNNIHSYNFTDLFFNFEKKQEYYNSILKKKINELDFYNKNYECKNINQIIDKKFKNSFDKFVYLFYQKILNKNIHDIIKNNFEKKEECFLFFLHDLSNKYNLTYTIHVGIHIGNNINNSYYAIPVSKIALLTFFENKKYFFFENKSFFKELENKFHYWFESDYYDKEIIKKIIPRFFDNKYIISKKIILLILIVMIVYNEILDLKQEKYKIEMQKKFEEEYEKQKKYGYLNSNSFEEEINNHKNKILLFLKKNIDFEKDSETKKEINNLIEFLNSLNNENNQNN